MIPEVERSLTTVLGEIVGNIQHLIRAEFRLARAEVQEQLQHVVRGAAIMGVAAAAGLLGVGVLLLACVYGLATVMPSWAAALVVGSATTVAACVAAASGVRKMRRLTLPPPKTKATIQETIKWAKTRVE